jgi:endonuclease YncB( thermonuclease family)
MIHPASRIAALAAALLWVAAPSPGRAAETYGPFATEVVRVIDGDTVELDVALWPGLVQRIHLRLDGVDTPEKRGTALCERILAQRASDFTLRFFRLGGTVVVSGVRLGKFAGRVLGRIAVDGRDLGEALVEAGLAKPYAGGKREPWC